MKNVRTNFPLKARPREKPEQPGGIFTWKSAVCHLCFGTLQGLWRWFRLMCWTLLPPCGHSYELHPLLCVDQWIFRLVTSWPPLSHLLTLLPFFSFLIYTINTTPPLTGGKCCSTCCHGDPIWGFYFHGLWKTGRWWCTGSSEDVCVPM